MISFGGFIISKQIDPYKHLFQFVLKVDRNKTIT